MATAGQDFRDYRAWMDAVNIDTSLVKVIDGKFCASFFCSTDQDSNQIASFYTGAMANAGELSMRTVAGIKDALVIVSPNDPDGMVQYAEECAAMGVRYIWDPGQQCARMEGIAAGRRRDRRLHGDRATITSSNCCARKPGMGEADILKHAPLLVVTKGENGCSIYTRRGSRTCQRSRRTASRIRPASAMRSAAGS